MRSNQIVFYVSICKSMVHVLETRFKNYYTGFFVIYILRIYVDLYDKLIVGIFPSTQERLFKKMWRRRSPLPSSSFISTSVRYRSLILLLSLHAISRRLLLDFFNTQTLVHSWWIITKETRPARILGFQNLLLFFWQILPIVPHWWLKEFPVNNKDRNFHWKMNEKKARLSVDIIDAAMSSTVRTLLHILYSDRNP